MVSRERRRHYACTEVITDMDTLKRDSEGV